MEKTRYTRLPSAVIYCLTVKYSYFSFFENSPKTSLAIIYQKCIRLEDALANCMRGLLYMASWFYETSLLQIFFRILLVLI